MNYVVSKVLVAEFQVMGICVLTILKLCLVFEIFYNVLKTKTTKEWIYADDGIDSRDNKNENGEKVTIVWTQKQNQFRNILLEPTLFIVGGISILLLTNLLQPLTSQV